MEGRTGLPVSGTPPFASPVPPPHGTVPAPVATSDCTVLSPVFADLPAGPNGGGNNSGGGTRTSTATSVTGIASPGHANYQGKLYPSSVAALGPGSGFSYLGNYISPSGTTDSYKHSITSTQAMNMNQYWLSSTEGYRGFPVGSAHPYPPYFTALNSLSSPGTQGLLAVSSHAKPDGQRFPASHPTRTAEGPSTKTNKTLLHGAKEGAMSPKTPSHQAGKSRHTSGSEDRRSSKHDSKNRIKDKDKEAISEKELPVGRSNKTPPKDRGNECLAKHDQKSESEVSWDSRSKKPDKSLEAKMSISSNPLTIEIHNNGEQLNTVRKCNGNGSPSPKKECANGNSSLSTISPKSKESSSEKRRKANKRKDIPVDVNGNAVLNVSVEKKLVQTSTVVGEKLLMSLKPSVLEAQHVKEVPSMLSQQVSFSKGAESLDIFQKNLKTNPACESNWTSSATSVVAMPLVSNPSPTSVPFSEGKLSQPSVLTKAASPASSLSSGSLGANPLGRSGSTSPSGASTSGVVSTGNGSPWLVCSTVPGSSIQRTSSTGAGRLNPQRDNLLGAGSPGSAQIEVSHPMRSSPPGAGPVPPGTSSQLGTNSSAANPKGAYPIGDHPTVSNHMDVIVTGANPPRSSPTRTNPLVASSTESSLTGTNPTGANPTGANQMRLSPSGSKPSRSSPLFSGSSPHYVVSGESSSEGSCEKEKLPSPRSLQLAALSTSVTSSGSKPISFPAHGSLPSPSSQPSYISHLPIYLHGTGHLSLEREDGREMPRDGSKVHATTFVPALGEFIPGPASSATIPVKESKTKTSVNGKESGHVSEKEKDKGAAKKDVMKVVMTTSPKEPITSPKSDGSSDRTKDGGSKSKDISDMKSVTKGKSEKGEKHEKVKKTHSSNKLGHESRDHHLSPSELSGSGKERSADSTHRTPNDLIHRETCRTSDAAVISTTPSVHGYPHHMSGYSVPLGSTVSSSREGTKQEIPTTFYSNEEQRRYMEWHLAATKRGYCYDHLGLRVQEPLKLESAMMHRTQHQQSFPSPRTDTRQELTPEHSRGREYTQCNVPQESMLRSVLTAGMHTAHSETQRTSPGSSNKATKQSSDSAKSENRSKSTNHGSKTSTDGLGSQGRSTPGTKGSDGRNPPVGIAVAQKRQDTDTVSQGRAAAITTPRNSPHVGTEDGEDRVRSRMVHGVEREAKHRDHSPRTNRDSADLLPSAKYHAHRYPGDLGSNLIVTGGGSLGPSAPHYDPTEGRMTPSHPAHLAIPPHWLPRTPGPPHASPLWLGHPFGLATPPATVHDGPPGHLQMPPAGFQIARDPANGQLVLVPQAPTLHSDSGIPPSMWPYLVPSHLQPHSHQLQQLVLNQPSFGPPLPHQPQHPLTHRPDQPLPNSDYHFALQQHQEALTQWYRQDEQRQREEQRRREQQSRKGSGEKTLSNEKSHKGATSVDGKVEGHLERKPVPHDVLNLKIPPHTPYIPGVSLTGQPPVPYVYPPQQVQYLYNHTGVYPAPPVSCASSPRTESGTSTASPKQVTKTNSGGDSHKSLKSEDSLKAALKSISVQTSPSETPASVEFSAETKPPNSQEADDKDDRDNSVRTEESEDQELIIVDVVDDDNDCSMLLSERFNRENKEAAEIKPDSEPIITEIEKPADGSRTSDVSSFPKDSVEIQSELKWDPLIIQKITSESRPSTPPVDLSVNVPQMAAYQGVLPAMLEEPGKESLITNVLTTTQSFASRMEALDQDQLAAIEGIALLSEISEQKAFSISSDNDKSNTLQNSQTRDDFFLLESRHQDNGTPLQGNTASAVTCAANSSLQLISQSCPTSPTDFIFKRDNFTSAGDMLNPNEVEMRIRLAELQRKYQEKKRELDKLQRKKDKKDRGSRSLEQDRRRGPGRPRKRKNSKEHFAETDQCPIIKSSTAVLLEAAASLEESSPFQVPKKKKKKDKEDREKSKGEEKKKSSKKDKESKGSHSEVTKSKKKKHKTKDEVKESSTLSSEEVSSSSGGKTKSKSKSKSKTSSSGLTPPTKDAKQKGSGKQRKPSTPVDSSSLETTSKSLKSSKTGGAPKSLRTQNSSTEIDSSSIIWPSSSNSSTKIPSVKIKSKNSKKKIKESKVKDGRKDSVKGQGSNDSSTDTTMEAIENVIRKSYIGPGNGEKESGGSVLLKRAVPVYEDDSDSPWETAMIDAKQKRNSAGQTQQKGLALLAGISSQELMKSNVVMKDVKITISKDGNDGKMNDGEPLKKKSGKAKKRSASPASSEQETPKKSRKTSPMTVKKEKDNDFPIKTLKVSKSDKKREKTQSEPMLVSFSSSQDRKMAEEKPVFNAEIWTRRRSERIFLSDISPAPSRDASPLAKTHEPMKVAKKILQSPNYKAKAPTEGISTEQGAVSNTDHNGVANIGSVLDALKTDTLQIRKKLASMSAQEDEADDTPRKTKKKLSKRREKSGSSRQDPTSDVKKPRAENDFMDSSCSDAENVPLSNLVDRQTASAPRSCIINKNELENGLRVLIPIDGLFYAGYVNAIQPPDVYGVILDGERGNRPHVFSQEQMLQETFVDVKPLATRYVPEGTRVCAYWSQQFRCLYPGTVVRGTPNPNEDPNFICVEFDDGDSGRIPVDHIRMLPHDFPIVEFEPIPNELQRKRRRRTSDTSSNANCKPETIDTNEDVNNKIKATSPKKKLKMTESSKSAVNQNEMDRISESGEDDVFLPPSQKMLSKMKKSKSHDKSKRSSSKLDSKSKEKKKKKKRKRDERRQESLERKRSKRSSSKSPRGSPARSPSRSPAKSKKKKRKEERKKKSSSKSSNGESSPLSKSKKKKSSSCRKKKSHHDERHSSFCTVETETVYSTHPITGSQALTEEELASEKSSFDGKGVWNKHRGTRDHSLDDWSSSDSDKDSSSDSDETSSDSLASTDNNALTPRQKSRSCLTSTSKMTGRALSPSPSPCNAVAFLPARQLWNWFGKATQRRGAKGKARKVFYRSIMRENEIIRQGDAAVFLSTGRPHLPYIGRIESMWESWGGNMVVRVTWFYHPEETKGGRKSHDGKMALYQSLHVDENDVQTISHKCEVLSVDEYKRFMTGKKHNKFAVDNEDVYYLAGTYDPTSGHITSVT
ncbi:trinucleotide repeat-containing gene 18 protein-like isoform X2 [Asterias rubens]|uniref:trinucleotide repeat-containing gene 18 protein-like isoform X2 n=1 Tax=Asterias rubens TaxID=7604 RepID=UPI001455D2A4|nr:trinucleotide repeat-containing gene 18 protein-like isoform X2 [Asterias rubens]